MSLRAYFWPPRAIAYLRESSALSLTTACGGMLPRIFAHRLSPPRAVTRHRIPWLATTRLLAFFAPLFAVTCIRTSS